MGLEGEWWRRPVRPRAEQNVEKPIDVYLEIGEKRIFAGAVDWPGWCRSGRDEAAALQALFDCGPRYEHVLRGTTVAFKAPKLASEFRVRERIKGNSTTDFGAPAVAPAIDAKALDQPGLKRSEAVLEACWRSLDAAVRAAKGKSLRTGPRGKGRNLAKMVEHVMGAEEAYLSALGWQFRRDAKGAVVSQELGALRAAMLDGLRAGVSGKIAPVGSRGGKRWSPRYFVRRVAWHVLDHAWEIEDRLG